MDDDDILLLVQAIGKGLDSVYGCKSLIQQGPAGSENWIWIDVSFPTEDEDEPHLYSGEITFVNVRERIESKDLFRALNEMYERWNNG